MIPVVVSAVAALVAAPVALTGSDQGRRDPTWFMVTLGIGTLLVYGSVGFIAKGVNRVTGDPGPFTPVVPPDPKTKWRPLNSKGKPIRF
jgi:hypothetical protein